MKTEIRRKDLVYPDLSYKIVGVLFDVYNELGFGYSESHYQKAVAVALKEKNIDQVNSYLKSFDKKLVILANFDKESIKFRRLVNLN